MLICALLGIVVSAILLPGGEAQEFRCIMGQEPDPASNGKYRWVIPVEDPCQCTKVQVGGVYAHTPHRPFKVTYYDTFLHSDDPEEIQGWLNCPEVLDSCQAYMDAGRSHGTGYYNITPSCGNFFFAPINVYCDQESNGGGWMRFYYKSGPYSCFKYDEFTWSGELVSCLGLDTDITGFAVSDDITTIDTVESWILNNGIWSEFKKCLNSACDLKTSLGVSNVDSIAHLGNCQTPSGADWSFEYEGGYAVVKGIFHTNGGWTQMYKGCNQYVGIGEWLTFRIGGAPSHNGEFVHTSCKDYYSHNPTHSPRVTSLWNSDNVRAMWIKTVKTSM